MSLQDREVNVNGRKQALSLIEVLSDMAIYRQLHLVAALAAVQK
jgi:hypothetical protein